MMERVLGACKVLVPKESEKDEATGTLWWVSS